MLCCIIDYVLQKGWNISKRQIIGNSLYCPTVDHHWGQLFLSRFVNRHRFWCGAKCNKMMHKPKTGLVCWLPVDILNIICIVAKFVRRILWQKLLTPACKMPEHWRCQFLGWNMNLQPPFTSDVISHDLVLVKPSYLIPTHNVAMNWLISWIFLCLHLTSIHHTATEMLL